MVIPWSPVRVGRLVTSKCWAAAPVAAAPALHLPASPIAALGEVDPAPGPRLQLHHPATYLGTAVRWWRTRIRRSITSWSMLWKVGSNQRSACISLDGTCVSEATCSTSTAWLQDTNSACWACDLQLALCGKLKSCTCVQPSVQHVPPGSCAAGCPRRAGIRQECEQCDGAADFLLLHSLGGGSGSGMGSRILEHLREQYPLHNIATVSVAAQPQVGLCAEGAMTRLQQQQQQQ